MLGKEQGCDFLVKRRNQNVARLHVEHFENRFCRRHHLHLFQLCVDIGKLRARLNDFHLRGLDIFLLCFGGTVRPLGVVRRNYFSFQ